MKNQILKLNDCFNLFRLGKIDKGIQNMSRIQGHEHFKSLVLAELSYFKHDFKSAIHFDEMALPFDYEWNASNILTEHFHAYTNASIYLQKIDDAKEFYHFFLQIKEKAGLLPHRTKFYQFQIEQHLLKLEKRENLSIDEKQLSIIQGDFDENFLNNRIHEFCPEGDYDNVVGANYILYFMFEKCDTSKTLEYYERYANQLDAETHHITASRLYCKINDFINAKKAIMNYVRVWKPIEWLQVVPMKVWQFKELQTILNPDLCFEILQYPKTSVILSEAETKDSE